MPDNKSKPDKQDSRCAAPGLTYELGYFARKHRISKGQAGDIIRQARGSREQANTLARWRRHLHLRQRAALNRAVYRQPTSPRFGRAAPHIF
jgi:hypothetical protein